MRRQPAFDPSLGRTVNTSYLRGLSPGLWIDECMRGMAERRGAGTASEGQKQKGGKLAKSTHQGLHHANDASGFQTISVLALALGGCIVASKPLPWAEMVNLQGSEWGS